MRVHHRPGAKSRNSAHYGSRVGEITENDLVIALVTGRKRAVRFADDNGFRRGPEQHNSMIILPTSAVPALGKSFIADLISFTLKSSVAENQNGFAR
jgi:hypothetical protein